MRRFARIPCSSRNRRPTTSVTSSLSSRGTTGYHGHFTTITEENGTDRGNTDRKPKKPDIRSCVCIYICIYVCIAYESRISQGIGEQKVRRNERDVKQEEKRKERERGRNGGKKGKRKCKGYGGDE